LFFDFHFRIGYNKIAYPKREKRETELKRREKEKKKLGSFAKISSS
jgi:hypothetical protein